MNKENCALKLVDEIILYYDARSKRHQIYEKLADKYVEVVFCNHAVDIIVYETFFG